MLQPRTLLQLFVLILRFSFSSGQFYIDDCGETYTAFRTQFLNKTVADVGTCADLLGIDGQEQFLNDECERAYGVPVLYSIQPNVGYCVQDDFSATVVFQVDMCCQGE